MNKLLLTVLGLISLSSHALELKVGDILLQPRDCWSCSLIEAQEDSIYSHMGMVIEVGETVKVVDALGKVKISDFAAFDNGTQKDQNISVRRFVNERAVEFIQTNKEQFVEYYLSNFDGLKYDHDFIWNNFDENGNEKLYCSEMVTKMLSGFLRIELPMKRMKFDINRDQWIKYFQGNPPDGKWGNAPASFEKSDLFYEVGEL
jgi:hypothetical protein